LLLKELLAKRAIVSALVNAGSGYNVCPLFDGAFKGF
jgi:hypothetical protein